MHICYSTIENLDNCGSVDAESCKQLLNSFSTNLLPFIDRVVVITPCVTDWYIEPEYIIELAKDSSCKFVILKLTGLGNSIMREKFYGDFDTSLRNNNFIEFVNNDLKFPYELHLYYKPEGI